MKIQVQLFANLRECLPEGAERGRASIDLPEGGCLVDLFDALGVERCMSGGASFVEQASAWQISVNGEFTHDIHLTLYDGDQVIVFPHMAGG